jgi:hypothetical protein
MLVTVTRPRAFGDLATAFRIALSISILRICVAESVHILPTIVCGNSFLSIRVASAWVGRCTNTGDVAFVLYAVCSSFWAA